MLGRLELEVGISSGINPIKPPRNTNVAVTSSHFDNSDAMAASKQEKSTSSNQVEWCVLMTV